MNLTSLSHGAGCACKIGARQLEEIRNVLPTVKDPALLVGLNPADDAAVYQLSDDLALVQTIDFFTPIVDDPFDFGRIAAANALSDIYAMGAAPILALNVLAFPADALSTGVVSEILKGGAAVASDANIDIAGGHSIDDPEPKYGLAVTGTVDPACCVTKAGAQPGDLIFLTKPIGGGLVTTAAKRGLAGKRQIAEATRVMTTLNGPAARGAISAGVRAMTDVTGFGLVGHLHEMCASSGLAAVLDAKAVPSITGALALATDPECHSGGSRRNDEYAQTFTEWNVSDEYKVLLTDAMTSGGLLAAIPVDHASAAPGVCIGRFVLGRAGRIEIA